MHLHCPQRATKMEKEKKRGGKERPGRLAPPLGEGENSDNVQAKEQGHFSFQMTHCHAAAHTGGQIGPHWREELQSTASSNYNNGRGECERRRRVRGRPERASGSNHLGLDLYNDKRNDVKLNSKKKMLLRFDNAVCFSKLQQFFAQSETMK